MLQYFLCEKSTDYVPDSKSYYSGALFGIRLLKSSYAKADFAHTAWSSRKIDLEKTFRQKSDPMNNLDC